MMSRSNNTDLPGWVFFWDIDGTLIHAGTAGERAMEVAFEGMFGREIDLSKVPYHGMSDKGMARMLCHEEMKQEPPEDFVEEFVECYLKALMEKLKKVPPGFPEGVEAWMACDSDYEGETVVHALLTGNLERGARIKLSAAGIWEHFSFGAYSDASEEREGIARTARKKVVERWGDAFPAERMVIIGDTLRDIACGKVISARTLAVATGAVSLQELAGGKPDVLLSTLADADPRETLAVLKAGSR